MKHCYVVIISVLKIRKNSNFLGYEYRRCLTSAVSCKLGWTPEALGQILKEGRMGLKSQTIGLIQEKQLILSF